MLPYATYSSHFLRPLVLCCSLYRRMPLAVMIANSFRAEWQRLAFRQNAVPKKQLVLCCELGFIRSNMRFDSV